MQEPIFILDGAKALSKAVRAFGRQTLIQRCQVQRACNIAERCPKKHVASVRRTLRKAWELDDAAEAERLIRDLACTNAIETCKARSAAS